MSTSRTVDRLSRRTILAGLSASALGFVLSGRPDRIAGQEVTASPWAFPPAAAGQIAPINGAELYYEVLGPPEGPPVMLLHGFLSNADHWYLQTPALVDAGYRVIAFDARAEGRSTWGDLPPTIAQGGLDAVGLLDYLGIARAHVVGWSKGANVAIELAIRHAGRVDRVIEYGGAYSPDCCYAEPHVSAEMPPFEPYIADYQRLSPAPERMEELFAVDAANPQNFSEAELGSIAVPFLVLDGAEEEFTKPEHIKELAMLIPGAELVLMPGTGHFAPWTHTDEFNRIMLAFLAGDRVGTPVAATPSA